MASAAGGLNLCSSGVLRRTELDRFGGRSVGVTSGTKCGRRIYQSRHRLLQLSPASYRGLDSARRTRPAARKSSIQEDSRGIETEVEQVGVEVTTSEGTQQDQVEAGWDMSWLSAFPHAVTAATANFMFGYHIGIINGPLTAIANELKFEGNTILEGLVVSIFIVGAFVGSISGGILSDKIGRRRTFQICTLPLIVGAGLSAAAQSVDTMVLGRLLVGVGIGVNTSLVPLYISEIAPTKFRGALGSLCQIGTCIGIIAALVFGLPSETDPHWWRTMFWIATIPGAVLIAGMQFSVESPRWLGKVGRWNEASSTIEKLWGKQQVEDAMKELRYANSSQDEESSWAELFSKRYFKVVGIGSALFALQQFAGINGVLYFSSSSFQNAGINNGIAASALVGVSNLTGALIASTLMDTRGRKILLMGSYTGMAISLAMMVSALQIPMDEQLSHNLTVAGTLSYVFTFALGAGPVTAIIIPEMCGTRIRAKALAVSLCVHWVCNFGIGLLFLELVHQFGLTSVYSSFGIVAIATVLFTKSFIIETKGRSLEEIELLLGDGSSKSKAS